MNVTCCINIGHKCVLRVQGNRVGHISVELEGTTLVVQSTYFFSAIELEADNEG